MPKIRWGALGLALFVSGCALGAQTPADPTARMFARDHVLQIDIDMAPADWREIRLSHRDAADETLSQIANDDAYQYKAADIRIDGVRVARVGVRKKGFLGSVVSTRPSLKVKFDEYVKGQAFAGLDGLTLNNNNQDQAMVQTFLAYDLYTRAGVPAPRASFAHMRVNGEDLGVYTHVEAVGKPFLRRAFGSSNGPLFESYAGDFTDARMYRILGKGNDNADRAPLGALKDALLVTRPVSLPRIAELVDLESFIRMWAIESLMGHWDSYSGNRNNYYLYVNPTTGKVHFIPWGPDSVFADPGPLQPAVVPKSFKAMGVLSRRLWELPEIRRRYQAVMRELLAGAWSEARLTADMSGLQRTLLPQSHLQPKTVETASNAILSFLETRRAEVEAELTTPGPDWPAEAAPAVAPPMTLTGSFTAPWSSDAPVNPFTGSGQLTITVDGKALPAFTNVGAFSTTNKQGDAAPLAAVREKYGHLAMTAQSGADVWQVSFEIDPFALAAGPGKLPVDHYAAWALVVRVSGGRPRLRIFGNVGELVLDRSDARAAGELRGTFTLRGMAP